MDDASALGRVAAVINPGSGGADARSAERMRAILERHGLVVEPILVSGGAVTDAFDAAVANGVDTLIVLGGDGTLACAADRCGPGGPRLLALPGGTMNVLVHALHGRRPWPETLETVLTSGRPFSASCGVVAGRRFYVNAILGAPTLLAGAREAVRAGKLRLAALRARRAWLRAFKGRLRFSLDGGPREKAGALSLICPLVSRRLTDDVGLEAAALDPHGALDIFRLGVGALFGAWRDDPAVRMAVARRGMAWANGRIPAVLDGEPHRFDGPVSFAFVRDAYAAWATPGSPALGETAADAAPVPGTTGVVVEEATVAA